MRRYELAREAPVVLNNIEKLYGGSRIETPHGAMLSIIFDVAPGKRVLALTMYAPNGAPIAICDTESVASTHFTVLESPVNRKRPYLQVPDVAFRGLADVDGMYVVEGYRGKNVGALMLKTSMELAKRFGSAWYSVHSSQRASKWYISLGGKPSAGGITFTL